MPVRVMTKMRNEYEDYSPFFVKPHTLASLMLLVCVIYLMANTNLLIDQDEAALTDPKSVVPSPLAVKAVFAMVIMLMRFGAIHLPNTIMTRPISFLWRALLTLFIMYIGFMVFLMMLPVTHAR